MGIVPAAGVGRRIGALPCSKEVFPLGFDPDGGAEPRLRVAGDCVLRGMRLGGASRVFWVLRRGKWDIPAWYGDGTGHDLALAYVVMAHSDGVPYTVAQAHPFVRDATVLLGFPDVLFEPAEAFRRLVEDLDAGGAALALGLFAAERPEKMDMVEADEGGAVRRVVAKPPVTDLTWAWTLAAWRPRFTDFLVEWVGRHPPHEARERLGREPFLGDVIQAAIDDGLPVSAVLFASGRCVDIGTPEDMAKVWDGRPAEGRGSGARHAGGDPPAGPPPRDGREARWRASRRP